MSAQTEKAIILLQQGRYAEAEAELRKSFSDSDDPGMTLSYLAIAQLGLNRLKDAENSSAQAIAQDPELAYAYFIRARVLRAATNERDSEKAIRRALELDPDNPAYYEELGHILLDRGQTKAAIEAADRGLQLDPESTDLRQLRTSALIQSGKLEDAIQEATYSATLDPEDPSTKTQFGLIALRQNDIAAAQTYFLDALRIDQENAGAKSGLVTVLKARRTVFRLFLSFGNWVRSLGSNMRWGLFIGAYILIRVVRSAAASNPEYRIWLYPLIGLYFVFIYLTWTIDALTTMLLRFDPVGRVALSEDEIKESNFVAASLAGALAMLVLAVVVGLDRLFVAAAVFATMVIPIAGTFAADGRGRRILGRITLALVALASIGLLLLTLGYTNPAAIPLGLYFLGVFAFSWIAQSFIWR